MPILQKILHYDFPDKWPAFIPITVQLLNTNDASSIFAGLQCLLAICRVFRFKSGENRTDFDKIVEATFPRLLTIGQGLVNETSEDAGEMLHIVLKAYKHATFVRPLARSPQNAEVLIIVVRVGCLSESTTCGHRVVLSLPTYCSERSAPHSPTGRSHRA